MKIGNIEVDEKSLTELCRRFGIAELSIFGSVLRQDFRQDSDIDVLYLLEDDARIGWGIVELQRELSLLFGRSVDLVSKKFMRVRFAERVLPTAEIVFTSAA